jgi:alkylhydroperoxidase family enzyme
MTTRIPPKAITGLYGTIVKKFSARMFGRVPESLGVMWHHLPVLKASMGFGRKLQKWDQCDESLKSFAHMAVASLIGCTWCLDFNYFMAHNQGLDVDKTREIPRWRESTVFTPLEREVLAYAEAMSQTPPTVTDEMVASLLAQLGPAGLIELSTVIGFANLTTRSNVALGIESEGFAAACGLKPMAQRAEIASPA